MIDQAEQDQILGIRSAIENGTDQQKAALHCLMDAINDVLKSNMQDCGVWISLISEADLLGHRPVTYWTNLDDVGKIQHLEYTLERIRLKQREERTTP